MGAHRMAVLPMSRDPERIIRVLQEIAVYWTKHPDLRLGQIVSNAASRFGGDPFHMEEDELILALRHMECPACRDRETLSRCHHCGRDGVDLKPKPFKVPEETLGYCNLHENSYLLVFGCHECCFKGKGI